MFRHVAHDLLPYFIYVLLSQQLGRASPNSALLPPNVLCVWLSCLYFLSGYRPVSFFICQRD